MKYCEGVTMDIFTTSNDNTDILDEAITGKLFFALKLSTNQELLCKALYEKSTDLARMYMGALFTLNQSSNPDNFAQSAHSIRELMEKLPKYIDVQVQAQTEKLKDKVIELKDSWDSSLRKTKCLKEHTWAGEIDGPVAKLLEKLASFFEWFEQHAPRRKVEITKTLRGLDHFHGTLPKVLEVRKINTWTEFKNYFQGVAHHNITNCTDFGKHLETLETFLLNYFKPQTFLEFDAIDQIIREGERYLSPEVITMAIEEIQKRAVNSAYFFDNIKSPNWIEPLLQQGMFQNPPPPEHQENGTSFPFWAESRYLVRMASLLPERVLEIILKVPETDNFRIYVDFIEAVLMMSPELAARWVKQNINWIKNYKYKDYLLPEKMGKLMSHLALGGQVDVALNLARALLIVSHESQTSMEEWQYREILNNHVPDLVTVAGERSLRMLCDLLSKSIQSTKDYDDNNDYSESWRPAIEEHEQNHLYGVQRDHLVTAIRNAVERLIGTLGKSVLDIVEGYSSKIFRRIGLHIRRKWPKVDWEGTTHIVANPDVFNDSCLHHELYLLLREQFDNFPDQTKQAYFSFVERGLILDKHGITLNPEDFERFDQQWKYSKLLPIREFLPDRWKHKFDAMKVRFGEIEHPEFQSYRGEDQIGPDSPINDEQLCTMEVSDIIEFFNTWQVPNDPFGQTPEGLGRKFTDLVSVEPARFAVEATKFIGFDPTYVRALITGIRNAARNKVEFEWLHVLTLCCWVINQSINIPARRDSFGDVDPGWGWTRRAIASLVSVGLELEKIEIPFSYREKVWEILKPLTEDPELTPEYEKMYGGSNMDPATLAINTTRGEAMHAVIRYSLWVRKHNNEANGDKYLTSFKDMPEVKEVLDIHLDIIHEPSLAIRSVYGRWLPWLMILDSSWLQDNLPKIFPMEEENGPWWDAAWEAYITLCKLYDNAFDMLFMQYEEAIQRLGNLSESKHLLNPEERLVEHLMMLYWRSKLALETNDSILSGFYEKATTKLKRYALQFIGRSLYNTKESIDPIVLDRLITLWEFRINTIGLSEGNTRDNDLSAFGWWFISGKFNRTWSMQQLYKSLVLNDKVEPEHLVLEHLAMLANEMPATTLDCLTLIVKNDNNGRGISGWSNHVNIILLAALHEPSIKESAETLIHYLGSTGHFAFRELLNS